ncbi:MAG: type I-E CRISPR-associated protein Cas7/Cse4/CasC [bacterium]
MLIEIHMLKNYPPVNLNRDESGAPKTCYFGNVQRGRISSQSLKRSWRTSELFRQLGSTGIRTRRMPEQVAAQLRNRGIGEDFASRAQEMLTGIVNKDGKEKKEGYTEQIVIYSPEDIEKLTQAVLSAIEADGDIKKFKARKAKDFKNLVDGANTRPITADIALFGRMVTSDCFRDVDAAMQVAHAISTHAVNRESDYFTAVDDLLKSDEVGAGMMGDVDYNSCCYYEYAALDVDQLRENLACTPDHEALVKQLVPTLIKTMAMTNPSGKQNTFAGQVFPSLILVECKDDKIPLSYVNAFEVPVTAYGGKGLVGNSIEKLAEHVRSMDATWQLPVRHRIWLVPQHDAKLELNGDNIASFPALLDAIAAWMEEERA